MKEKNLLPIGSKFFSFTADPFQKGFHTHKSKQEVLKVVSFINNSTKSFRCIHLRNGYIDMGGEGNSVNIISAFLLKRGLS